MGDSLWFGNSSAPTWLSLAAHAWSGHPPKLLESVQPQKQIRLPAGCSMRELAAPNIPAAVELWSRYFSITPSCRCLVPVEHVTKMITTKQWVGLIVVSPRGDIIGTIVRRCIRNLHVREAVWPSAVAGDYFCIHPGWRKKGVGRALLHAIHNTTPNPFPPVLMFWDKPQLRFPPLAAGIMMSRVCAQGGQRPQAIQLKDPQLCKAAWMECVKGNDVWSSEPGEEISFWAPAGHKPTVVWNTFHRTIPDGGLIGIVLSRDAAATEALASVKSQWGVLLAPATNPFTHSYGPSWKINSIFQWIGYNLSVGFVSGHFPAIGF
jgi:hypothetical protein